MLQSMGREELNTTKRLNNRHNNQGKVSDSSQFLMVLSMARGCWRRKDNDPTLWDQWLDYRELITEWCHPCTERWEDEGAAVPCLLKKLKRLSDEKYYSNWSNGALVISTLIWVSRGRGIIRKMGWPSPQFHSSMQKTMQLWYLSRGAPKLKWCWQWGSCYIIWNSTCSNSIRSLFGWGSSLVVQWLGFPAPSAGGPGSIPGKGTRSCHNREHACWNKDPACQQQTPGTAK